VDIFKENAQIMKITLAVIGKTEAGFVRQGIEEYAKRLQHYVQFNIQYISDVKGTRNMSEAQQKIAEGRALLATLESSDHVTLLDEHGTERTSVDFAQWLQRRMASGSKRLVLVVGGPYGFSQEVYERANEKVALSKMTFPHDLVRLIFVEQLYRAFTILRHEPYHHE
jgi:23S rRNA (pseudouridine1915-N3)-methyltransferase